MRTTKRWGFVNSTAQEYMLNHAERTRKRLAKKKPTGQRLPAFKVHKNTWILSLICFTIRY